MHEKLLKYENVYGLFKNLYNISKMLLADQYFDNCYCNLTIKQCWLCNLADYVRHNKIKDDLLRYKKHEDCLIDIAYRLKKPSNEGITECILCFCFSKKNSQDHLN